MNRETAGYPREAFNAHWFGLLNAVAYQVMMGGPIVLFAKSLGASSTVLGIIAAFTPLMTVMQLPAARFMARTTYRRFVLGGWSLRTLFIFAVAVIPLLGFLDDATRVALLLAALFLFNLLRGISSAAWMPWIAAIIPEEARGRFLSRDQIFNQAGSLVTLLLSGLLLLGEVAPFQFTLVFLLSATGATASLFFINRIPDAPQEEAVRQSSAPVPWLAILRHPPFFRLLVFNAVAMFFFGGLGPFTVAIQREEFGFRPDLILLLGASVFVGPLVAMPFAGGVFDRVPGKTLMGLGLVGILGTVCAWFGMAAGLLPQSVWVVGGCHLVGGLCGGFFNVSNGRLTMATMPLMGRNHFFALFTVISSVVLGVSPVAWGLMLDAVGGAEWVVGPMCVGRYAVYFASAALVGVGALGSLAWVVEPPPLPGVERSLLFGFLQRRSRDFQR